ncbi:MAG: protein of unknown function transrane [Marmoricola sp.]|nr:protein of unknown function transrane [Marmoricola sp.]
MAVLFALIAAVAYGLSDFAGGLVARRTSAWSVAVVGQSSSMICTAVVAMIVSGHATHTDLAWGAAAGIGSGIGTGFLYRGFANGRMGVVAPVSAVGAALVPVVVGLLGGERPQWLVWFGVIAALPAIWLVSSSSAPAGDEPPESTGAGFVDGILAGLGFGALFATLGQVPGSAGLWPLALTQLVSVPTVIVLALVLRGAWRPRGRRVWWALVAGPLGTTATAMFLLASQRGYLTVAGVLTSLYPASTVLLAALVLKERVHRTQAIGLALCAVSVTCVALG